jgi:calcineurin-like phosphoesterase family protein
MSRLLFMSDLHLGHDNAYIWREGFSSPEDHHNTIYDNLASELRKSDTLYLLGDVCFTKGWLQKVASLKCRHKMLVVGNHDTERGITMQDLCLTYDKVVALTTHRNYWLSHAPIHPREMRGRIANIHGHTHANCIEGSYINACAEQTEYKPITFEGLVARYKGDKDGL